MGRKVHPTGFRTGVIYDWKSRWYADKNFAELLQEDLKLRKIISQRYMDAGVSQVEIERQANNEITVTVHTSRPGIVIGRGGQRVDETRSFLEAALGKKVRMNVREVPQAELDAYLVARSVSDQLERRIAHRRAMKQTIFRTMQAGAKGIRIVCSGRLGGAEIARREKMGEGRVPLQTLRADIDYGLAEARTQMGRIGVKVWIYKGDILPEREEVEFEEAPPPGVVLESGAGTVTATPAASAEAPTAAAEAVTEPVAEVKTEPVAEVKAEPVAEVKAEPVAEVETEPVAEAEAEPVAEVKAEPVKKPRKTKAKAAVEVKADTEAETEVKPKTRKPRAKAKTTAEAVTEAPVETETKAAAKPRVRKSKAADKAEEVKDVTAEKGETSQDS
jgi:small subunit ribosomal protein S3